MRKTLLLTVLCGGLGFSLVQGQNPPDKTATPAPDLSPLIDQLGDQDFRKRDEAVQLLRAQGLAALPALRKAITHSDPEVRRQVQELIPALEVAAIIAPRRVTLKMTNKPLQEIFNEMTKQSGIKIESWSNNPAQHYSYDFRNATFWEAVDRISRDAGLMVQQGYGDDRLRLNQQNGYAPFVVHDGPFRYVATNIQHTRSLDLNILNRDSGPAQRSDNMTFSFSIFVEPRLSILGTGDVKLTAAYDNEKNSLLPPEQGNQQEMQQMRGMRRWSSGRYGNRANFAQSWVQLNRASEKATTIKLLRGTMPINLLAEQKPVVVTDQLLKAKGKKVTIDTTTIQIADLVEQGNKQLQIKLSIVEDNKDNNDYTWMNTMYQRLQVQDEKGNVFQNFGTSWGNSGTNHVELTMTFAPANGTEKPAKLIFQSWTTLVQQVNFEFKDLPLP